LFRFTTVYYTHHRETTHYKRFHGSRRLFSSLHLSYRLSFLLLPLSDPIPSFTLTTPF
ncbi:unnamed protein product, partial [Larinioides sclopetarius]